MPLTEEYLKSVSETQLKDRAYTPFEMQAHERGSLEDIRKGIKKGSYKNIEDIQDSLEFLERLATKINIAIMSEKKENKTTWELEVDLSEIKKIFDQLEPLLLAIENNKVENTGKRRK